MAFQLFGPVPTGRPKICLLLPSKPTSCCVALFMSPRLISFLKCTKPSCPQAPLGWSPPQSSGLWLLLVMGTQLFCGHSAFRTLPDETVVSPLFPCLPSSVSTTAAQTVGSRRAEHSASSSAHLSMNLGEGGQSQCGFSGGRPQPARPVLECLRACLRAKSLQSCLTLCHPVDCSPPGSSVHRILQARILE